MQNQPYAELQIGKIWYWRDKTLLEPILQIISFLSELPQEKKTWRAPNVFKNRNSADIRK